MEAKVGRQKAIRSMKVSQTEEKFYRWLQFARNSKPQTINVRKAIVQIFKKEIGNLKVSKIKVEDLWKWRQILTERGINTNSQKVYLLTMKLFCQFCKEQKWSNIDYKQIKAPKMAPPKEVVYLTNGEVEKFVSIFKSVKYRAIVECLLSTAARISELLSLNRGDITDGEIKIVGKNDKERVVFLTSRATIWLNKYLKTRKDRLEPLFLSSTRKRLARGTVENVFRLYREANGIEKPITPHKLRHTAASNLYQNTKDLVLVSNYLGHNDVNVTKSFYVGLDKEKLKRTILTKLDYTN